MAAIPRRLTSLSVMSATMISASLATASCAKDAPDQAPPETSATTIAAKNTNLPDKPPDHTTAPLHWETDEATAFSRASAEGKDVLVDFRSEWCAPCKEMEEQTFSTPSVSSYIAQHFIPLRFDVTEQTDADTKLQSKYRAQTLPVIIFLSAKGDEKHRLSEFTPPDRFLAAAAKATHP